MDAHHHGDMPGLAAPELAHHDVVDLPPLGAAAARAVVTPTSDNAHLAVGAVEEQRTTDLLIFNQRADDGKRFATLVAELALRGYEFNQTAEGAFIVHRWGQTRALDALDAVAGFARQVGVQS